MKFNWDKANRKHIFEDNAQRKITQQDIEFVLKGDSVLIYESPLTTNREERWVDAGFTSSGRLIFVVWTWRKNGIRPITAWEADPSEVRLFERRRNAEYGKKRE